MELLSPKVGYRLKPYIWRGFRKLCKMKLCSRLRYSRDWSWLYEIDIEGSLPFIVLPFVDRGLPSLVILCPSDCSRKESLLTGAISHIQILSFKHAHFHLPVYFTHTLQCRDSKTMLKHRFCFGKKWSLSCNLECLCRQAAEKNVSHIPKKGGFAPTLLQPAIFWQQIFMY